MRTKGLLAFCPTRDSLTVDIGYQLVLAVKVIEAGCMYARDNGFVSTGNQKVTFQSGAGILSAAATTRFTGTQAESR
jgi:hypothetical protein